MNEFLFSLFVEGVGKVYFIDGKSIYKPIRKVLNFLFCLGITAFAFKKIYGPYQLYDLTDYKRIIEFFLNGDFFISFTLFVIVFYLTSFVSFFLFDMYLKMIEPKSSRKVSNWIRGIIFKNREEKQEEINKLDISFIRLETIYQENINIIKKANNILSANFSTALRGIIALIIYFISIKHFGWVLFSVSLFLIIIYTLCLRMISLFFILLPSIRKTISDFKQELSENVTME